MEQVIKGFNTGSVETDYRTFKEFFCREGNGIVLIVFSG